MDPSIAVESLGLSPEMLMKDFNTLGYLFENLVSRNIKVYMEANGGMVKHYHDKLGLECDLVAINADGRYALLEVKLGSKRIDQGASNLLRLASKIPDAEIKGRIKTSQPSFMAVITSTNLAYRRDDGVYVLPISCLKD